MNSDRATFAIRIALSAATGFSHFGASLARRLFGTLRPERPLIIGVVGQDGAPPYVIKWLSDGHIAMVTPDPYSRIVPASDGTPPEQLRQDDQ